MTDITLPIAFPGTALMNEQASRRVIEVVQTLRMANHGRETLISHRDRTWTETKAQIEITTEVDAEFMIGAVATALAEALPKHTDVSMSERIMTSAAAEDDVLKVGIVARWACRLKSCSPKPSPLDQNRVNDVGNRLAKTPGVAAVQIGISKFHGRDGTTESAAILDAAAAASRELDDDAEFVLRSGDFRAVSQTLPSDNVFTLVVRSGHPVVKSAQRLIRQSLRRLDPSKIGKST